MGGVSQLTHQLLVQLSIDILYMRIHQSLHLWVQPFGMESSQRALLIFSNVPFGSSPMRNQKQVSNFVATYILVVT